MQYSYICPVCGYVNDLGPVSLEYLNSPNHRIMCNMCFEPSLPINQCREERQIKSWDEIIEEEKKKNE